MEITDVETYTLRLPIGRTVGDSRLSITDVYWVVVELTTDDGSVGTGWMGSLGYGPDLLERFVDSQFADLLVGRDPWHTEAIRADLRLRTIYYGELGLSAWPRSAIDVALWDLKAQAAGRPLYEFTGGSDPRVRAYASNMDAHHDLETLRELLESQVEAGFTAFKTKVGNRPLVEEVDRLETVREAIGPDADLFVDANQAWTVDETITAVERLDSFDLAWVEEPISEFDVDGHRRVAEAIRPPLATGEMFYRPERFDSLIENGGLGVVQPDLVRGGGVTGQLDVARRAASSHLPFAPHFYYAISAHLVSAVPTGWIVEYIPEYDVAPVLETPPTVADGYVELPDAPGHGYAVDPDAREEFEVSFD
ncbi:mandelate racemase/muconate lactonizing enzyme family protein [Natronorarus salvus]|uniref:mandelate racemase/muconate lactonizing enzyme family protein n=1 Tax=Natronorarus salvus TaxID=3117733 RepID=UPI002F269C79